MFDVEKGDTIEVIIQFETNIKEEIAICMEVTTYGKITEEMKEIELFISLNKDKIIPVSYHEECKQSLAFRITYQNNKENQPYSYLNRKCYKVLMGDRKIIIDQLEVERKICSRRLTE